MLASSKTTLRLWSVHIETRSVVSLRCSCVRRRNMISCAAQAPLAHAQPPVAKNTTSHRVQQRTYGLDLYAVANVQPKTTGLPMTIYISNKSARHGPRINVSQQYGDQKNARELFSMTIEEDPRIIGKPGKIRVSDLIKVGQFIHENRDLLLDYWRQEPRLDTLDMLLKLTKV